MPRSVIALASCFFSLLALGCPGPPAISVTDDLHFSLFNYELHTPYVVGARVRIHVDRRGDARVDGWSGEVTDSSVFAVEAVEHASDGRSFTLRSRAVGPGETRLLILDERGKVATSRTIRVEAPDRIALVPAGLIKVRGDDAPPADSGEPIRILSGGTATFEVTYHRGPERLFGNGALSVELTEPGLVVEVAQTYLFENREWLRLTMDATGLMEIGLDVGGQEITRATLEGVTEDVITGVEIEAEPTRGAKNDSLLYLLAHAYDEDMGDVWGVGFRWAVDGYQHEGDGDLFYYYYEKDSERVVSGSVAGLSDEVVVFMSGGGVTSSNSLGCSAAGDSGGLVAVLLVLILMALRWGLSRPAKGARKGRL